MSKSDALISTENAALSALPELPRDVHGPVFAEPWQAQIFSMACVLNDNGFFSWNEWAQTLGAVIREMPVDCEYYQCWLIALERISLEKNLVVDSALADRRDAWDRAARATPHGEPIHLGRECE